VVSRLRFGQHRVNLRQSPSGNWHFECFIEGKQYRESLHTASLEAAREAATNLMVELLAKVKAGLRVHSVTLEELRVAFSRHLDKKIAIGKKEASINNTILHLRHGFGFLHSKEISPNTSVDALKGSLWQEYITWRMERHSSITKDVLLAELTHIRSMFKFAKEQGWCSDHSIPKWELQMEIEPARRRRITPAEFQRAFAVVRSLKNNLVITVLQVMLVTGARTGEILQLRYRDITIAKNNREVTLNIRKETSKTRKGRELVLVQSQTVFLTGWVMPIDEKNPDDLVFSSKDFYLQWKLLRRKLPEHMRWFEPYYCRHEFITQMLLKGENIHNIAKYTGTSTQNIEKTYSQVLTGMLGRGFAKSKMVYDDAGGYEVVKR
jgi:integrase